MIRTLAGVAFGVSMLIGCGNGVSSTAPAQVTAPNAEPRTDVVKNPALRDELLRRHKTDTDARAGILDLLLEFKKEGMVKTEQDLAEHQGYQRVVRRIREVELDNIKWLKATVTEHGWPTSTLVGKPAVAAAFRIALQADAKFQHHCLDLVSQIRNEGFEPFQVAQLTDRVAIAEGKPQIYGTCLKFVDGKLIPRPVQDPGNIDKRRAALGLKWTFAEWTRRMLGRCATDGTKPKPASK